MRRGFTLIELLVVIAIIGLLSAVVLASLSSARAKGRDARRAEDMHSVVQALELYASDNGSAYPATDAGGQLGCGVPHRAKCLADLAPLLVPKYLPAVPADPAYGGGSSDYVYCRDSSDTHSYLLAYWLEATGTPTWCRPQVPAAVPINGCGSLVSYPAC
ncbi:MAG TPA: type II secretion system protein [Candidatus Paceibacterota bacterium]|nr:type II secretion system protein [Candidatus Paceibacterota bacterium]